MHVDCTQAEQLLLDAVEGTLPAPEKGLLAEHLARCADCNARFQETLRAYRCLLAALPRLAPADRYLTTSRFERLQRALSPSPVRTVRLITWRRFVAAAAVAAIIVSAYYIAGDIARLTGQQQPGVAGPAGVASSVPVVLAAAAEDQPPQLWRPLWQASPTAGQPPQPPAGLLTSSADAVVPVRHILYDPGESARWW